MQGWRYAGVGVCRGGGMQGWRYAGVVYEKLLNRWAHKSSFLCAQMCKTEKSF